MAGHANHIAGNLHADAGGDDMGSLRNAGAGRLRWAACGLSARNEDILHDLFRLVPSQTDAHHNGITLRGCAPYLVLL